MTGDTREARETRDGPVAGAAGEGRRLPVAAPDADLTIPANRLAGSADCLNCGTRLQGPFCHYCGQPDRNFLRFFPVLLRELLEDFLDFDSRFVRTMKPLLFRPGKLTRDYLDGRRFRYTPPLRLYIFSSIACFFLAALIAGDSIRIDRHDESGDSTATGIRFDGADEPDTISINGKPWDRETNPFVIEWMPDWVNDRVNDEIEQSPRKGKEIEENPDLIKDKIFDVLPVTMFLFLPIVALLFKFWYLFAGKYYIEHLIFALHNHSFLFVMLCIVMLLNALAGWAEPAEEGRITSAVVWVNTGIGVWVPLYLLISLKRVYRQGWAMTLAKYCLAGFSYVVLLGFATAIVALLSFVLL